MPDRPRRSAERKNSTWRGAIQAVSREDWKHDYAASILERLREGLPENVKFVEVGRRTGFHPETARRYMIGGQGPPPTDFIAALCTAYGLDPAWVLGFAPKPTEIDPSAFRAKVQAELVELIKGSLGVVASSIETMDGAASDGHARPDGAEESDEHNGH